MSSNYKKHALFVCIVPVLFLSVVAIANYCVDPLQFFACNESIGFYKNPRLQNSGLIRSYLDGPFDYDAVIIGTSLSENFDISKKYGNHSVKPIRLTMFGGYWKEHYLEAQAALETGRVKKVFWELRNRVYMEDNPTPFRSTKGFPEKLYTAKKSDFVGSISYLLNGNTSALTFDLLKNGAFNDQTVVTYNQWMNEHVVKGRFLLYNSLKKKGDRDDYVTNQRKVIGTGRKIGSPSFENFKRMLSLAVEYPSVEFSFFIPPVSLITSLGDNAWALYPIYIKALTSEISDLPNVKLFSFVTLKGIVNNNANYEDENHYGQGVNDFIFGAMLDGDDEITVKNVDKHLQMYHEMLEEWPVYSDFSQAIAFRPQQLTLLKQAASKMEKEFQEALGL
nr:hypothetical protein [uncultured Pseudodesulfovibrio sp.]